MIISILELCLRVVRWLVQEKVARGKNITGISIFRSSVFPTSATSYLTFQYSVFSLLCSTQKAFLLRYPKCNRTSLSKTEFLIQIYMTLGTLPSTKYMTLSVLEASGGGLVVSHTFHIPVAAETENKKDNAGRSWWFWRPWKSCDCLMNQVIWHCFP